MAEMPLERDIELPPEELPPLEAPLSFQPPQALLRGAPLPVQEVLVYDPTTNQAVQAPSGRPAVQPLSGTVQNPPAMVSPEALRQQQEAIDMMFTRSKTMADAERAVNVALQFQRMRHMDQLLKEGRTQAEAFVQANMRYPSRESAAMIRAVQPPQGRAYGAPTTVTLGGADFGHIPGSATLTPIRPTATTPEGGIQAIPIINPDTGEVTYGRPGPGGSVIPLPKTQTKAHPSQKDLDSARAKLAAAKASRFKGVQDIPALEAQVAALEGIVGSANQNVGANAPTKSQSIPMPLPARKDQLIKGELYVTPRGVATWDGEKFTTR